MRLKRLEIAGFKSFRDKVVLDFRGGISAVVGPNGCGKSNIVDAIRWVMGEQRVKMLRGKKMDDVIFNGSEGASPVGLSEVCMTMSSDDGLGFTGTYVDCTEVSITRRLFRDGESEYAINNVPCRLLDVREFFMGTGVGSKTYSLVEQNSVASLVEAKPEERRQFIEEAAGISKYKSRKESAIRKMEATQQNLVRVNDIIREVKNQLNALSRQAKRAEQYRTLRKGIKETELTILLQTSADLAEKREGLQSALTSVQNRELESKTRAESLGAELEQAKLVLLDHESKVSETQEKIYSVKNEIGIKEQAISFLKQKSEDLRGRKSKIDTDLERLRNQLEEAAKEMEAVRSAHIASDEDIETAAKEIDQIQSALETLKANDKETHRTIEEKKISFIDVVTRKANLRNSLTSLIKSVEELQKRGEKNTLEREEQDKRLQSARRTLEETQEGQAADEAALDDLIIRKGDAADELERVKSERQELEEKITETKEEISKISARLQSLREFQEGYAWCSESTKTLMSARQFEGLEGLKREDFLGLVADHIDVPKEYETAVEAVLGEKLQYILVKTQREGVRAIDYLKSSSLGRCSFVPLEARYHVSGTDSWEHLKDTVKLIDVVKTSDDIRGIAPTLLGDVVLIPDLSKGVHLWRQNGFMGTFVTPEGDIITPQGVLTGGSRANGERSLLQNKREIAELDHELKRSLASLEADTETRRQKNAQIVQWEEELVQLRSRIHQCEIQINGKRKDLERFEDECRRLQQRLHVLSLDQDNLLSEIEEAAGKKEEITRELSATEKEEGDINCVIAALQQQWTDLRSDVEKTEGRLTEKKVHLASLNQKREANRQTIERLEATGTQTALEIEARTEEARTAEAETEDAAALIAADEQELERLYVGLTSVEESFSHMKGLQQEKEDLVKDIESRIREAGNALERIREESKDLEVQYREIAYQLDGIKQTIQEKDFGDISQIVADFVRLPEEEIARLRERIAKDRQTVEGFGEVNLLAIEEYEQLKERHEFLSTQAGDLNTSLNDLQKTITQINQVSRKRFADTFEAVNASFKDVFARLFPGGRGELKLTDETDMLETGVDIDIQVPGKRAQNITLLSGGEKSLAAIALIFAIILHRPSPFLLLDEVDAALDDANISLFNNLLKDIAAHSQIMMVTHNKRSMEVASHLYGITMQQQGVSTVVSVNLQ
jgi:chromosome segregation protein